MNITSHALPLIPPVNSTVTIAQCDAEIKALSKIHNKAIEVFWNELKHNEKAQVTGWSQLQLDMHRLFHFRNKPSYVNGFEAPDDEHVSGIWKMATSELDTSVYKKIQMSNNPFTELVAILTTGDKDEDVTLVHRYTGPELHNISDENLSVSNDSGDNWYYRSRFYEPEGFSEGPYGVPLLYIVGTVNSETNDWTPKNIESSTHYQLESFTETMENLIDCNSLPKWKDLCLPTFPSGVESKLHELNLLRSWMNQMNFTKRDEERVAINSSTDEFLIPIEDMRSRIKEMQESLKELERLKNRTELEAFLTFYGFELGQVLTHATSGSTGVLTIADENNPLIYIAIDGQEKVRQFNNYEIQRQLRLGEWSLAEEISEKLTFPRES